MRRTIVALALIAGTILLPACNRTSPCATLSPPTQGQINAAAEGAEVEKEIGGVECVVDGNHWMESYGD
jgi:hypothetical protein